MIFLDSETAGFLGPSIIWQWAEGETGEIHVHHAWDRPVGETLALFEMFVANEVCAFNLPFDWYMVNKDYNVLRLFDDYSRPPTLEEWKRKELRGSREALCLKPQGALDLYLHGLKGPMQVLMNRDPIVIRRVPVVLAELLCKTLSERVSFHEIFFQYGKSWYVDPQHDPAFPDIVLSFGATAALKPVIRFIFGIETEDFPIPSELLPEDEDEWYPWWNNCKWPEKLPALVAYWRGEKPLRYAIDDVRHLQRLFVHWGRPGFQEDDSILAVSVAATRWRGFALDRPKIEALLPEQELLRESAPRSPAAVLSGLRPLLSPVEALAIKDTKGETLEAIERWGDHPAAIFAKGVIAARTAEKRANLLWKLKRVGSFHPDARINGTKSSRMAGRGGLNAQGIDNWEPMRSCFLFAFPGEFLSGGDMKSFEPNLADSVYDDPQLRADLTSGKKIHGLFGEQAYELDYNIIVAQKEAGGLYDRSKKAFLAYMYGGQEKKIAAVLDREEEEMKAFFLRLSQRYPKMSAYRESRAMAFCSMRQPAGLGTRVIWHTPSDYVETKLGDRRYYTLENTVCHTLFVLAQHMPQEFASLGRFQVKRRDRTQTATGATQTALYAAAFGIQSSNMRSALNHEIQAFGARINKNVQRRIWDLQPCGIRPFRVRTLNVHDEIQCANTDPVAVECSVNEGIDFYKPMVPLLGIDWHPEMPHWGVMK